MVGHPRLQNTILINQFHDGYGWLFGVAIACEGIDMIQHLPGIFLLQENELREEFEIKQARAANLGAYKAQLAEMRESFGTMLRQLPNRTEVAGLLVDVSQTGLASGLKFELFQPQKEVPREFYAELPIKLRVTGNYHQFGEFVSGLAALPRIVTIHDIVIKPREPKGGDEGSLELNATAKTYRYLEEGVG